MNITVGKITSEEYIPYKNLRLEALQKEPQAYLSRYDDQKDTPDEVWKDRLLGYEKAVRDTMIFAKDGDKLIGMMGAFWDPTKDTAYIIAVYLQAEYRGKGISKQMMKELLAEIKKKEYIKRIVLGVNKSQEAAIKLYESFGFKQTKVEEAVLGDGNSHCEIIMERKITL